jgi:L-lysine 6-transaminase
MFFVEGGTLAIENTLKTAFDWKIRKNLLRGKGEKGTRVLHFQNAFHGRSGYSLSLTNTADLRKTQYFPKFDWPRLTCPRLSFPVTEQILREAAAGEESVERRFAQLRRHRTTYGLIISRSRARAATVLRPELFRRLRKLADQLDFLIFDEVQTGVGLTGAMWAWQHFGAEPDLFTFGKKTQVCGFVSNKRIDEIEDNVFRVSSRINSTWGGNLVDMVRCARYLEIIAETSRRKRRVGDLQGRLSELAVSGVMTTSGAAALHRLRPAGQGHARPHARRLPREWPHGPRLGRQRRPLPPAPDPQGQGDEGVRKLAAITAVARQAEKDRPRRPCVERG